MGKHKMSKGRLGGREREGFRVLVENVESGREQVLEGFHVVVDCTGNSYIHSPMLIIKHKLVTIKF